MENKGVHGLSSDPEGKVGKAESGSISSDQELQRLMEDVEKVESARRQHATQEDHTTSIDAVESDRESVEEQDRLPQPDGTEQILDEFAVQVEKFMQEAEAAAIERPALALLAAFSLGVIVGQMFSRR